MKVNVSGLAKAFVVPSFAIIEVNGKEVSVPLNELDDVSFYALVEEWVELVYKKANKKPLPASGGAR